MMNRSNKNSKISTTETIDAPNQIPDSPPTSLNHFMNPWIPDAKKGEL